MTNKEDIICYYLLVKSLSDTAIRKHYIEYNCIYYNIYFKYSHADNNIIYIIL